MRKAFPLVRQEGARAVFDDYIVTHRRRAGEQEGAPHFAIPQVGTPYPASSFPALEAAKWLEQRHPELAGNFEFAVFEAFFGRVEDISAAQVLERAAAQAGVPEPEFTDLHAALKDHRFQDAVLADYREGLERGINGIPTVIVSDAEPLVGAVPVSAYRGVLLGILRAA